MLKVWIPQLPLPPNKCPIHICTKIRLFAFSKAVAAVILHQYWVAVHLRAQSPKTSRARQLVAVDIRRQFGSAARLVLVRCRQP